MTTPRRKPPNAGKGRIKGVPNKVTVEVRAAAQQIVENPTYRASLVERITAGTAPQMEQLLWHYAYGKPVERVALTDADGHNQPVQVVFRLRADAA